jgi:hypothetical protein
MPAVSEPPSVEASSVAPSSVAPEPVSSTEAAPSSVVPATPPSRSQSELVANAQGWVDGFGKGDCEFALADVSGDRAVRIREFNETGTTIAGLSEGFTQWAGIPPTVTSHPIATAQCAIAEFVKGSPALSLDGPRVSLAADAIANGGELAGVLRNGGGWTTTLLVIDNHGTIYDVSGLLATEGGERRFGFPLSLTGDESGKVPMLVVAISSKALLDTLRSIDGATVWTSLRAIRNEAASKSLPLAVSVAWFQIG